MRHGFAAMLTLVLWAGSLGAQAAWTANLGVDRFGVDEGMPGLSVTDIEVGEDGRLWVLASGLLADFDGERFTDHPLGAGTAWSGGRAVGIGAGRGDTLWVTVGSGLYAYLRGRMIVQARHDQVLRDVRQDADGRVWAWDSEAALLLGADGFERVAAVAQAPRLASLPDEVWIDVQAGGARIRASPESGASAPPRGAYRLRRRGSRFDVTDDGGAVLARIPADGGRRFLLRDRRQLVWTLVPGAVEAFASDGTVVATLPVPIGGEFAVAREDPEGNIWLGSPLIGLFRIRALPVRTLATAQGLPGGGVAQVADGGGGSVLVTSRRGHVHRVSRDGVETIVDPRAGDERAASALVDRNGTLWIASLEPDGGRLHGTTRDGRRLSIRLPVSPSSRLRTDPVDDGRLWLVGSTVRAVLPYAPRGTTVVSVGPEAGWPVGAFATDGRGEHWMAGPRGLIHLATEGRTDYLAAEGFPTGNARSLLLDDDGTLWIGRYGAGLVRLRDGEFTSMGVEEGLWDNVVASLIEDREGRFWMAGNRGVHRVARSEVEAVLDGRRESVRAHGYGGEAGFLSPETTGEASHRSPDGRLWFPTFDGVAVIDPAEVDALGSNLPGIRIRAVNVGENQLPPDSLIRLQPGARSVVVDFGAIRLRGSAEVRHEVWMEGVDADWTDVGQLRRVSYANLPPGRSTFRVRAVAATDGVRSDAATLALEVPHRFTETDGFALLLLVSLGAALAASVYLRSRTLEARAEALTSQVRERTAELAEAKAQVETALLTVETQAGRLRSLDRAKSRFFANVSHELRTPLTLLRGPLDDVLEGRHGRLPRAAKGQLAIVRDSGRRLTDLVEQLLDLARLEEGHLEVDLAWSNLAPLLRRLEASFGALAASRGIAWSAELPSGPTMALVDLDRMEKVYANLLANALKFTPEGERVSFSAGLEGDRLRVSVEDSGPGIAPSDHERIFERFTQVDESDRRAHGGAGLGLTLVREITELHGGRVELRSTPGEGSRFTVRIPVGLPQGDTEGGLEAEDDGGGRVRRASPTDEDRGAEDAGGEHADDERPTVLVVEDHPDLRAYIREHLEGEHRVVEAHDGVSGLAEARRTVPDVILCDIMMPRMDGETLCLAIRADPELSHLPVVMLTAKASQESRLSALEGGADDYLVKPFDPAELRLRIGNLLAARRRLAERVREEARDLPLLADEFDAPDVDQRFAARIRTILGRNLGDEDFDTEALARATAMSRASLYRRCGELLGVTPAELIWAARLDRAAELLRTTDATAGVIAYACGFKTVPHFARRFRERFGASPAAYRDSCQEFRGEYDSTRRRSPGSSGCG